MCVGGCMSVCLRTHVTFTVTNWGPQQKAVAYHSGILSLSRKKMASQPQMGISFKPHAYPVYATTAGSPYVYRNYMICTVRMGDNDMHKPHVHTKFVSTLCHLYKLFCSSKKAVLVLKCSSMVVLNEGVDFKVTNFQTSELKTPESCHLSRNG